MIYLLTEKLISVSDAPKYLPARPNGKRVHISACYRWIGPGVCGIRLESVKVGGSTYTSLEALQRFSAALTSQKQSEPIRNRNISPARGPLRRAVASRLELELGLSPGRLSKHS